MEQYLEAADKVLDAAIVNGPQAVDDQESASASRTRRSVKPTGSVYRHLDDSVAIFSSWVSANIQVTLWSFYTATRGKYRFRISGIRVIKRTKPITFHVTAGTLTAVDRGAPCRLLRRASGEADRDRVRRASGGEEHHTHRRGRPGRDRRPRSRKWGGELQGAGTGRCSGWRSKDRCTTPGRRPAIAGSSAT